MMFVLLKAPIGKKKIENHIHQKGNETEVYFKLFQSQVAKQTITAPSKGKIQIRKAR